MHDGRGRQIKREMPRVLQPAMGNFKMYFSRERSRKREERRNGGERRKEKHGVKNGRKEFVSFLASYKEEFRLPRMF